MRYFNSVGIVETCSTAILYFIAMPYKYIGGNEILVTVIGPIHGLLWTLYIGLLGFGWWNNNWNRRALIYGFILSLFPGGPIWLEKRLQEERFIMKLLD
ncbi:MAG: DUF3817 domain-containing protein [Methanobacteriota archaeon]|nr:MAG: DUF3817 domain-containing protein [Euryarchaeota archaeon]|tara:strand:- start:5 stop:301 length:297 start_codon:yes stop_codon:yes gene_type:complete